MIRTNVLAGRSREANVAAVEFARDVTAEYEADEAEFARFLSIRDAAGQIALEAATVNGTPFSDPAAVRRGLVRLAALCRRAAVDLDLPRRSATDRIGEDGQHRRGR